MKAVSIFQDRFSSRGLWVLFTAVAFPIHVWTIILFFYDYAWIAKRTNAWDAVGVGAYALLIALIESIAVFLIVLVLSFLLPKRWTETQRIVLMGTLAFLVFLWGIFGQVYLLVEIRLPDPVLTLLANNAHPFRLAAGFFLLVVVLMILLPVIGVMRSKKFTDGLNNLFERVSVLTSLYIAADFIGLIIVISRNLRV